MAAPRGLATAGAVLVAFTCLSLTTADSLARALPTARSASALHGQLTTDLRKAGGASSALVIDETTGQTLLSVAPRAPRLPASVEKLYTTTAALLELGPSATFTTSVLGVGALATGGHLEGDALPARRRRPDIRGRAFRRGQLRHRGDRATAGSPRLQRSRVVRSTARSSATGRTSTRERGTPGDRLSAEPRARGTTQRAGIRRRLVRAAPRARCSHSRRCGRRGRSRPRCERGCQGPEARRGSRPASTPPGARTLGIGRLTAARRRCSR